MKKRARTGPDGVRDTSQRRAQDTTRALQCIGCENSTAADEQHRHIRRARLHAIDDALKHAPHHVSVLREGGDRKDGSGQCGGTNGKV